MTDVTLNRGRVLIVEPMGGGFALIAAALDEGFDVVVATYDDGDRRLPAAALEQVEKLVVDTNDEPTLTSLVLALHEQRPFNGIMAGFEFYVDTVARLADRLGLPGLPVSAVLGLRDKAVMRSKVEAAGLRVPRYAAATDAASLAAAAEAVGFPAVLKPADSAGSVHVSRVDDAAQLERAHRWMAEDDRTDLGRGLSGTVLLEEYVQGPEISVEGYVRAGEVTVVSVTGKLLGPEPYFVEVGHIVQREMEPAGRLAVEEYVAAVCRALDLDLGPFHCELRLAEDGPVLIEIGARLAGGHIIELVEMVTGVSLVRVLLAAATGRDVAAAAASGTPRAKCAGIVGLTAPELSTFTSVHGLDEVREAPDVLDVQLFVEPGDEMPRPDDFRARIGHVIFQADSYGDAVERWHSLKAGVSFA